jgi:Cu+-exporting ATPase
MKKLIYILPILLLSCNSETTNSQSETEKTEIAKKDIKADTEIKIEIEGMTCEMGCVTTIRNKVNRIKGVTNFEMDFDAERSSDFSKIQFDSRVTSSEEIKNIIEEIAQGIYSVVDLQEFKMTK